MARARRTTTADDAQAASAVEFNCPNVASLSAAASRRLLQSRREHWWCPFHLRQSSLAAIAIGLAGLITARTA